MISKEEVERIAKLARLELSDDEIKKMQKDLSSILDYFKVIQNANLKIKNDNSKLKVASNILREDKILEKSPNLANNLIAQVPDKKDGYIKVKNIF